MKYWNVSDIVGGGNAPRKVARIHDAVVDALDDHGWPGTHVVRVGRSDHDNDFSRFEVDVELAPGVVLPTPRGSHEGLIDGWEEKSEDVEQIVTDVVEGLTACRPLLPALAETLHDMRRRARAVIAGWQLDGIHAEFVDVRLAPYDHWRGDTAPKTLVLFEGPGESLRREIEEVHVEASAELEVELEYYRRSLEERDSVRIALAAEGASGSIDQLALNAIGLFADIPTFLRQYQDTDRLWLQDSTAVHMREGHVCAATATTDGPVDWHGQSFTFVVDGPIPKSELDAAVGGPASALFAHPYLSPDIIVGGVFSSFAGERHFVTVSLEMSTHLFCSVTGRVWQRGEAEPVSDGGCEAEPEGENVVAFKLRAG